MIGGQTLRCTLCTTASRSQRNNRGLGILSIVSVSWETSRLGNLSKLRHHHPMPRNKHTTNAKTPSSCHHLHASNASTTSQITPIRLFLGREVGLEVRRAVVLGAAAVAGV